MREHDLSEEQRNREDVNHIGIHIKEDRGRQGQVDEEEIKEDHSRASDNKSAGSFYVCCLDEYLSIFSHKTTQNSGKGGF